MPRTNPLVGKTITSVWLAADRGAIKFDIEGDESIVARCDGDCCSHTWIEGVEAPEATIGTVLEAVDIPMPQLPGGDDYYECIQYYGFRIRTAKGDCIIDYRNSSNGYYGGNLSWPNDDYFYGGVFGQNISNEGWSLLA